MTRLKKLNFAAMFLICALLALPAFALDLQQARSGGILGEKLDGYVAVLQASPEAQSLAAEVNARRREEYAKISRANSQPVDVVAKLAAQQIIKTLPPGARYQALDGSWTSR